MTLIQKDGRLGQVRCKYCCQSVHTGSPCNASPTKKHVLISASRSGKYVCIHCGQTNRGIRGTCIKSPHGWHEYTPLHFAD